MFKPDLLTMLDGTPVTSAAQWRNRRAELIAILEREEYGIQPVFTGEVEGCIRQKDERCCAGHAVHERIDIAFDTPGGRFSFPMQFVYPADRKPHPLLVFLNFRREIYDPYCPLEEIIDHGFALGDVCYTDVTTDDADMTNGLAGCWPRTDPATDWGKLSMWGFAASRALDYLLTRPEVDGRNCGVIGHSRLGKAALVCGMYDERFRFILANDSGCGGDALEQTKHPGAETFAHMDKHFPFWFCGNRSKYAADQSGMPFDQHFLLAAIAPRFAAVGSASKDIWADPHSQQLCCAAATPAWTLHGVPGFIGPTEPAQVGNAFRQGRISYHLRDGLHYLNRTDWLHYMAFVKANLAED